MSSEASQLASRAIAAEVTKRLKEASLVIWLDAEDQYSSLVDSLAGKAFGFPYPVVALRGSYLELLLALEPYGNGPEPDRVLVHLPRLNKESMKESPVYELCAAGKVFEKNLGTLVREAAVGVAKPEEVETFVRTSGLTLAGADAWLEELSEQPHDGLSLLTQSLGLDDTVLAILATDRRIAAHLPEAGESLLAFLEKGIGLSAAWRRFRIGDAELRPDVVAILVASWLMALEFVHDLTEPPVMPELRAMVALGPFAKVSRRLAKRFRDQLPDTYEEQANGLQTLLDAERTSHHARALGAIDTFRFEESTTRAAVIEALCRGEWAAAKDLADGRTTDQCFWVKRSVPLQRTWELLRRGAAVGAALTKNDRSLGRCGSLDEAADRYAEKLAPVDREHRLFEQRAHALMAPDLDDYDAMLDVRASVRRAYRAWSDGVNRAFFDLCVAKGPLPSARMRQRTIYEDVVHPKTEQPGRTAFFMVDALRFEMAQGLADELKLEKYRVALSARLAELPTETKIGMNLLAPLERNGRLRAIVNDGALDGFRIGETSVRDPGARLRVMSERSLSSLAEDIQLDEFANMSLAKLKKRLQGKPALVVVHSRELDTAGEHNLHLGTFEQTLALLKAAISLLSQAGIERIVISSDHGFLLQDPTAENVPFGASKRVPQRRHAVLSEPSGMPDVLEVRLSDLEYDAAEDLYLVFAAIAFRSG